MKILFLISLILLVFLLKKNIEPVILSCCGGIRLGHDFKETDPNPPKRVRRCIKSWDMPCTSKGSPGCCEGKDYCKSTKEGGKCKYKDGSGYYIYEDETKTKVDYTKEKELEDIKSRIESDKKTSKEEEENESMESNGMEIVNYLLIGIILIVISVMVGLFFFSGDEKDVIKTDIKTKSTFSKYDKYDSSKWDRKYK